MNISLNWLKHYTTIDRTPEELATLIGARLVEIEGSKDLTSLYQHVVVAEVKTCHPVEGSDHLNVTTIDDGGVVAHVERTEDGLIQVVCGASNIRAGIKVAWLPPETIVPETAGDDEPFVLGSRKLRGVMSHGMIASPRELALFDDHEGILVLDSDVAIGQSFAEAYELDDVIFDIENKSLTHRPDTFGVVGFAREVAAIQGHAFTSPDGFSASVIVPQGNDQLLNVSIDDPALSDRYQAVVLDEARQDSASPLRMQTYLARVGVRPINAIVDVTNYVMLKTGQPLHAFDYDKVARLQNGIVDIHVRTARSGESLALLDGRTIQLDEADIVIANGDIPIALAGAMGGAETEIDATTSRIMIESATFNLFNLRSTQMRHGIFSEAITRFTKGQPAELTQPALAEAVAMLIELTGARPVSLVTEAYPGQHEPRVLSLSVEQVNAVLGTALSIDDIKTLFEHIEFGVEQRDEDHLILTVPFWRADIHITEDLIEEVGRVHGFDEITPTIPLRTFLPVSPSAFDRFRADLRHRAVRAGSNEVVSYSFIHGDLLKKAGLQAEESYRITNSISPDLQYYRQSLVPSLLQIAHMNSRAGFDAFSIFEVNKVHQKQFGMTEEQVPSERNHFAAVWYTPKEAGSEFYALKHFVSFMTAQGNCPLRYERLSSDESNPLAQPFEPRRAAELFCGDVSVGFIGELKQRVARAFKVPASIAAVELNLDVLFEQSGSHRHTYEPLSKYPAVERDICFKVAADISYADLLSAVEAATNRIELSLHIEPLDFYQGEDTSTKNMTLRLSFQSYRKTLTGDEVSRYMQSIIDHVTDMLHAEVL